VIIFSYRFGVCVKFAVTFFFQRKLKIIGSDIAFIIFFVLLVLVSKRDIGLMITYKRYI